jgi:hypothetical protein
MVDKTSFENEAGNEGFDMVVKAATHVKEEVERLVEEFDLQRVTKRVEDFSKENPIGFAMTALALGVVAGILMRVPRNMTRH